MTIIACGINYKTADIALREKVIFSADKIALYLNDLITNENVHEAVVISTCNRSEIYCETDCPENMLDWFCRQHALKPAQVESVWYCYENQQAVEHIMRVACGLDSMVLGETQIAGQMKEAFSEACAAGSVGSQFNRLFQQVFAVAKEVRTNTAIGGCPVSIASAAVHLAKSLIPAWQEAQILLLGAGDTIQLVLRYLQKYAIKNIIVANRRFEATAAFAGVSTIGFSELPGALQKADIVISATGSPVPIVKKEMLAKRQAPIFIIDIAVPRDVALDVAELSVVQLFSIDDLKTIIQHNQRGREHAAEKAREVIEQCSEEFMNWLRSQNQTIATIRAYRKQIEDLCAIELAKALQRLDCGEQPEEVLVGFAHTFTNKLLHNPSVQLRQAGASGKFELLKLVQQLLAV